MQSIYLGTINVGPAPALEHNVQANEWHFEVAAQLKQA